MALTFGLGGFEQALAKYSPRLEQAYPRRWSLSTRRGHTLTCTLVTTAPGFALELELGVAAPWSALVILPRTLTLGASGGLVTGDAAFDGAVFTTQPSERHRGLFSAPTRALIRRFVALGGMLVERALRLTPATTANLSADDASAALDAMIGVADVLARTSIDDALMHVADIAATDPDSDVRAQYATWAQGPDVLRIQAAREAAASRPEDPTRLREMVADRSLRLDVRNRALERLASEVPLEQLAAIPASALLDLELADDVLIKALKQQADRATAVRAAWHLSASLSGQAPTRSEPVALALLAALDGNIDSDVAVWLDHLIAAHTSYPVRLRAARERVMSADADVLLSLVATRADVARWLPLAGMTAAIIERLVTLAGATTTTGEQRARLLAKLSELEAPALLPRELALRLIAALDRHPDASATTTLLKLAAHAHESVTRGALQALLAAEAPGDIVERLQPSHTRERVMALAPEVARARGRDASPLLRALFERLPVHLGPKLVVAYLETLAHIGDRSDTPRFVDFVGHADDTISFASIRGLALLGDHRALAALKPLTAGLFKNRDIKAQARDAMAAIIEREGDRAGAMTVADDASGRLSVDEPERG